MTDVALSAETIEALKKKHVAFLLERLASDAARADWIRSFADGYEWVLGLRVRDVVDPVALTDGVAAALGRESIQKLFAPVLRDVHRRVLASLKKDDGRLADYVDADARAAIDALLERSDLVPEKLVREVFAQDAIEEALRDILFDGLKEFNETVNPFFADWGLPALLRKMPIGGGAILKSMGAVRGEFDKRLEPEIRKFLQVFSRKAKGKLADFAVAKGEDPKMIELRKNVVSFLYTQSMKELLAGVDDAAAKQAEIAAEHIVVQALGHEHPRRRLREGIDTFLNDHGDATIGQWLGAVGATEKPDLAAWAALLWPHVQRALTSPVSHAFFEKVTAEFYDGLPRS